MFICPCEWCQYWVVEIINSILLYKATIDLYIFTTRGIEIYFLKSFRFIHVIYNYLESKVETVIDFETLKKFNI